MIVTLGGLTVFLLFLFIVGLLVWWVVDRDNGYDEMLSGGVDHDELEWRLRDPFEEDAYGSDGIDDDELERRISDVLDEWDWEDECTDRIDYDEIERRLRDRIT